MDSQTKILKLAPSFWPEIEAGTNSERKNKAEHMCPQQKRQEFLTPFFHQKNPQNSDRLNARWRHQVIFGRNMVEYLFRANKSNTSREFAI